MSNLSPIRVLANHLATICIACLAMAAASIALAQNDQNQTSQPNQDQPQAQSSQPTGPQLEAPSPQQFESDQSSSQPANREGDWRSDRSRRNSQPGSRSQQGASLGVNIISSGEGQGVTIMRVHSDTPAQQMGLRPRDRITSVNGQPVGSSDEFIATIRGMNPGDEVELGIVRDESEQTIRGALEPYGQALARNQGPSGNDELHSDQGIISRDQPSSNEFSSNDQMNRVAAAEPSANLQTSYEDHGPSSRARSGDVNARLDRLEQQLDRLTQDIEELRNTIGTTRLSPERPSSGLREAASAEFRATGQTQTPTRANTPQQNGSLLRQNDRWNTENRFEQGDLPGARERAAQATARRRAEQTGARLQQQERDRNNGTQPGSQPNTPSNSKSQKTPSQPPTDQLPSDKSP